MLQTLERYDREGTLSRARAAGYRAFLYMRSGSLMEAHTQQQILRREEIKEQGAPVNLSTSVLMWLRMRLGRPVVLLQEDVARGSKNLLNLRWWAVFAVEANSPEPLADLVARFEQTERGSQSVFVHEELQFARGCLAFVRGDARRHAG